MSRCSASSDGRNTINLGVVRNVFCLVGISYRLPHRASPPRRRKIAPRDFAGCNARPWKNAGY